MFKPWLVALTTLRQLAIGTQLVDNENTGRWQRKLIDHLISREGRRDGDRVVRWLAALKELVLIAAIAATSITGGDPASLIGM